MGSVFFLFFCVVLDVLSSAVKQSMKYFGAPKDSLSQLELRTVTLIGSERCFSLEFPDQRSVHFFFAFFVDFLETDNFPAPSVLVYRNAFLSN